MEILLNYLNNYFAFLSEYDGDFFKILGLETPEWRSIFNDKWKDSKYGICIW